MKNFLSKVFIVITLIACVFASNSFYKSNDMVLADEVLEQEITFDGVEGLWEESVDKQNNFQYANEVKEVGTAEELAEIAYNTNYKGQSYLGVTIKLTSDIDLAGKFWSPIGANTYFEGDFDGNGFTIYNMNIDSNMFDGEEYGLFGVNNGSISNVLLKNVKIKISKSGTSNNKLSAGAIAGYNKKTIHDSGAINVNISYVANTYVGGLVGNNTGESVASANTSTVYKCFTENANVFGDESGLLCGNNQAKIRDCYSASNDNRDLCSSGNASLTYSFSYDTYDKTFIYYGITDKDDLLSRSHWGYMQGNSVYPVLKGVGNYTLEIGDLLQNNGSNGRVAVYREKDETSYSENLVKDNPFVIIPMNSNYYLRIRYADNFSTVKNYTFVDSRYSDKTITVKKTLEEQTSNDEINISIQAISENDPLSTNRQRVVKFSAVFDKRTIALNNDKFAFYDVYNTNNTIDKTKDSLKPEVYGLNKSRGYTSKEISDISNKSLSYAGTEVESGIHYTRLGTFFAVEVSYTNNTSVNYKQLNFSDIKDNTGVYSYLNTEFNTLEYDCVNDGIWNITVKDILNEKQKIPLALTSQFVAKLDHSNFAALNKNNNNCSTYTAIDYYVTFSNLNREISTSDDYFQNVDNPLGHSFLGYKEGSSKKADISNNVITYNGSPLNEGNITEYTNNLVIFTAEFEQINYNYNLEVTHKNLDACNDDLKNMGLKFYNQTKNTPPYSFIDGKVSDTLFNVGDKIYIYATDVNSDIIRIFEYLFNDNGDTSNFKLDENDTFNDTFNEYIAISVQMIGDYKKSENDKTIKHSLNVTSHTNRNISYIFRETAVYGNQEERKEFNIVGNTLQTPLATYSFSLANYVNNNFVIVKENISCITELFDNATQARLEAPYGYILVVNTKLNEGVTIGSKSEYSYWYNGRWTDINLNSSNQNFIGLAGSRKIEVDSTQSVYIDIQTVSPSIGYNVHIYLDDNEPGNTSAKKELYRKIDFGVRTSIYIVEDYNDRYAEIRGNVYPYKSYTISLPRNFVLDNNKGLTLDMYEFVGGDGIIEYYQSDQYFKFTTNEYINIIDFNHCEISICFVRKKVDINFEVISINGATGQVIQNQLTDILYCDLIELSVEDDKTFISFNESEKSAYAIPSTVSDLFVGYYYDEDLENPIVNSSILNADYINELSNKNTLTIYAVFDKGKYNIELKIEKWKEQNLPVDLFSAYIDYKGENLGMKASIPAGHEYTIVINNEKNYPIKEIFDGEVDIKDLSLTQICDGEKVWNIAVYGYNVTLNENYDGGNTETFEDFALYNLMYAGGYIPERTGYEFKGWYQESTCENYVGYELDKTKCTFTEEHELFAKWEPYIYKVTFDGNLGDYGSGLQEVYVEYDSKKYYEEVEAVNLTTDFSIYNRVGYEFLGYSSDASAVNPDYIKYQEEQFVVLKTWDIPNDTTLYAVWKNKLYEVSLNANTGDFGQNSLTKIYAKYDTLEFYLEREGINLATTFAIPTKLGYNFVGYSLDEFPTQAEHISYNNTFEVLKTWKIANDNASLYAVWESIVYKVTFDNGITTNDSLLGEVDTTGYKELYVMYGTKNFYLEETCETLVSDFAVYSDENNYITFLGYSFEIDDENLYISYNNQSFEIARNWDIPEDTTVYGVYAKKQYKISYKVQDVNNESKFNFLQDSTIISDVNINEKLDDATTIENNNKLEGFTILSIETNRLNNVISLFGDENLEITIKYERNEYIVSFDSDGGSEVDDITVYYGLAYGNLEIPLRVGYTFISWTLDSEEISENTIVSVAYNHTLVSVWENNIYEVVLNLNGGEEGSGLTTVFAKFDTTDYYTEINGVTPTSNFNIPTRLGFDFIGYASTSSAEIPDYIEFSENIFNILKIYDIPDDTVFYAVWKGQEIEVSFDTFGGNEIESVTLVVGQEYGILTNAVKVGYVFEGWFLSKTNNNGSGVQIFANTIVTIPNDHTLYAKYKAEEFYLDFKFENHTSKIERVYNGEYLQGELKLFNDAAFKNLLTEDYFSQVHLTYTYTLKKGETIINQNVAINSNTIVINEIAKNVKDSGTYKITVSNTVTSASVSLEISILKYEIDFNLEGYIKYLTKGYDTRASFESENITVSHSGGDETFKIQGVLENANVGDRTFKSSDIIAVDNFDINNYDIKNLTFVSITKKYLKVEITENIVYQTESHNLNRNKEVEDFKVYFVIEIPEETSIGSYNISEFVVTTKNVYLLTDLQNELGTHNFDIEYVGRIEISNGTLGDLELSKILTFSDEEIVFDGKSHCIQVVDLQNENYTYEVSYEVFKDTTLIGESVVDAGVYKVYAYVDVQNFNTRTLNATLIILKREVVVTANNNTFIKTYDGTTNIIQDLKDNVVLTDVLSGGELNTSIVENFKFEDLVLSASYDDKNVGQNKLINFETKSSNYILSSTEANNKVGVIEKKDLLFTLNTNINKIYDRLPIGEVAHNKFTYQLVDGDILNENFTISFVDAGSYDLSNSQVLINNSIQNNAEVLTNYNVSYSGNIIISPAVIVLKNIVTQVVYNGEEQEIVYTTQAYAGGVNVNSDEIYVEYYQDNNLVGTSTADGYPKNAGTYNAIFKLNSNFIFLDGDDKKLEVDVIYNITQKNINEIRIDNQDKTYNGEAFVKTFNSTSTNDKDKVFVSLCTNHIMELSVNTVNSNAGTYYLQDIEKTVKIFDKNNNDVTSNYTFENFVGRIEITKGEHQFSSVFEKEYIYTYDKTAKTLPQDDPVFEEVRNIVNVDTNYEITFNYSDGISTIQECINAGTYFVDVIIENNNYTFPMLSTKIVIKERLIYTSGDFSKTYDGNSMVTADIPVLDYLTKQPLEIQDDVTIVGYFVNNIQNKTLVSNVNPALKIYLQLDGNDKANYALAEYDLNASINKRSLVVDVNATEIYTSKAIKVSYTKMTADNLVSGQTLGGTITFTTCVNVNTYNLSGAGYILENLYVYSNGIDLKKNYDITVVGTLVVIPATIELQDITDIEEERIYHGKAQVVTGFEFVNSLNAGCLPVSTDYVVTYLNNQYEEVEPVNVGSYYVNVKLLSDNFTFVKNGENIDNFTFTAKTMQVKVRTLTISIPASTKLYTVGGKYKIVLPNVVKVENLVEGQKLQGVLSKTIEDSGYYSLNTFDIDEEIKVFKDLIETTSNYNIVRSSTPFEIETTKIDCSQLENLVYNGKIQKLIIGEFNSIDNPEMFSNIKDSSSNSVQPINAGNYTFDYIENGNTTTLSFTIKKLKIYGEVDKAEKQYDGTSTFVGDISVVYYENNNLNSGKKQLSELGTGESVVLSAKFMNKAGNKEKTDTGEGTLVFQVESARSENFELENLKVSAKINPKQIVLDFGEVSRYYTGNSVVLRKTDVINAEDVLVTGDTLPSALKVSYDYINVNTYNLSENAEVSGLDIKFTLLYTVSFSGSLKILPAEVKIEQYTIDGENSTSAVYSNTEKVIDFTSYSIVNGQEFKPLTFTRNLFATVDANYTSVSKAINVGRYKYVVTLDDEFKDNYKIVDGEIFEFEITKKVVSKIDISNTHKFVYDFTITEFNLTSDIICNDLCLGDVISLKIVTNSFNVGKYYFTNGITYKLPTISENGLDKTANYDLSSTVYDGVLEIIKADIKDIRLETETYVFDKTPKTLVNFGENGEKLTDLLKITYETINPEYEIKINNVEKTDISVVNAGTYNIQITVQDDNYNDYIIETVLTIEKRIIYIDKNSNFDKVYDGKQYANNDILSSIKIKTIENGTEIDLPTETYKISLSATYFKQYENGVFEIEMFDVCEKAYVKLEYIFGQDEDSNNYQIADAYIPTAKISQKEATLSLIDDLQIYYTGKSVIVDISKFETSHLVDGDSIGSGSVVFNEIVDAKSYELFGKLFTLNFDIVKGNEIKTENYKLFFNGNLTVNPAELTINFLTDNSDYTANVKNVNFEVAVLNGEVIDNEYEVVYEIQYRSFSAFNEQIINSEGQFISVKEILNAGEYSVTFNIDGEKKNNYSIVSEKTFEILISKKLETIDLSDDVYKDKFKKYYGGKDNLEFEYTTEFSEVITVKLSRSDLDKENAGTYDLFLNEQYYNNNYKIQVINGENKFVIEASTNVIVVVFSEETINSFVKIYDGQVAPKLLNPSLDYTAYLDGEEVNIEVEFKEIVFDNSSSNAGKYKLILDECILSAENYSKVVIDDADNIFYTIKKLKIKIEDADLSDNINPFEKIYDGNDSLNIDQNQVVIYNLESDEIIDGSNALYPTINCRFESKNVGSQNIIFEMPNYEVSSITGNIIKKNITIKIKNSSYEYGYRINSNDFNYDVYDANDILIQDDNILSELDNKLVLVLDYQDTDKSSSQNIKVGTYNVTTESVLENFDFTIIGTVEISKCTLDIRGDFNKQYDGTNVYDISKLTVIPVIENDQCEIISATYENENVGTHIITFVLDGIDCENYLVSGIYGDITTKLLTIKFNYESVDESGLEVINPEKISGKAIGTYNCDYNSTFTDVLGQTLPILIHEGYTFGGWQYEGNNVTNLDLIASFVSVELSEITLDAVWIRNSYSVELVANISDVANLKFKDETDESLNTKQIKYGEILQIENIEYQLLNGDNSNYEFIAYKIGDKNIDSDITIYQDTILTCQFAKISSKLILSANGGIFAITEKQQLLDIGFEVYNNDSLAIKTFEAGENVNITDLSASKVGYDFAEWRMSGVESAFVSEFVWKNNKQDIELFAYYAPKLYNLYIDANGGYFDDVDTSIYQVHEYNLDSKAILISKQVRYEQVIGEVTIPLKAGFEFEYFIYSESKDKINNISQIKYNSPKDITILAVYKQNIFALSIGDKDGKISYTLEIDNVVQGSGKYISKNAGKNQKVRITALADNGYVTLNEWTVGNGEYEESNWVSTNALIEFENLSFLNGDISIFTSFEASDNEIVLSSNDYNKGNISADEKTTENASISVNRKTGEILVVTIIEADGYEYYGYEVIVGNALIVVNNNQATISDFSEDIEITFIFTERTNSITVKIESADYDKGKISYNGNSLNEYTFTIKTNAILYFEIKTSYGYTVNQENTVWQNNSNFEKASANFEIKYIQNRWQVAVKDFVSDGEIIVAFDLQKFNLTYSFAIIEDGVLSPDDDFEVEIFDSETQILDNKLSYSKNIQINVTSLKQGYHLYGVSNNNVNIDTNFFTLTNLIVNQDNITFDVLGVIEIVIVFEINSYDITILTNGFGETSINTMQVKHGQQMDLSIISTYANDGYEFAPNNFVEVVDGIDVPLTDLIVTQNRTIKAIFTPKGINLSIFAGLREADKYENCISEQSLFESISIDVDDENVFGALEDIYNERNYILTKTQTGKIVTIYVDLTKTTGYEVEGVYSSKIKNDIAPFINSNIEVIGNLCKITINDFSEDCDILISFKSKLYQLEISFVEKDEYMQVFKNSAEISIVENPSVDDTYTYVDGVMTLNLKYNATLSFIANINFGYVLYDIAQTSDNMYLTSGISCNQTIKDCTVGYSFTRQYDFEFDFEQFDTISKNLIKIYVKKLVYKIAFNLNYNDDVENSPVYYAQIKYGDSRVEKISDEYVYNIDQIQRPTPNSQAWSFVCWTNPDTFGMKYFIENGRIYTENLNGNRVDRFYGTGFEQDYLEKDSYEITLYAYWQPNSHKIDVTYFPNSAKNFNISFDDIFTSNQNRYPYRDTEVWYISTADVEVKVPTALQGFEYVGYRVVYKGTDEVYANLEGTDAIFAFKMPNSDLEIQLIYSVCVSISAGNNGQVSWDNNAYFSEIDSKQFSHNVAIENPITIYAKANSGYEFLHFEINGQTISSSNEIYDIVVSDNGSFITLKVFELEKVLFINAKFIGKQVTLEFVDGEYHYVEKVNNSTLSYENGVALTSTFRVGETINFSIKSKHEGFKFSYFEDLGSIYAYTITADDIAGVRFVPKSTEKELKFRIQINVDGTIDNSKVLFNNGYKAGEIWTLKYGKNISFTASFAQKHEFGNSITLNNKILNFVNTTFNIDTTNSIVVLDENHVNNIIIRVQRLLWYEYAEELYNRRMNTNNTLFVGNGSESSPYIIGSVDDLAVMMYVINNYNLPNSNLYATCYYQMKISLNVFERFWMPIGVRENPFNGTFIYGGYSVSGIDFCQDYPVKKENGLFGYCGENAKFIKQKADFTIIFIVIGSVVILIIVIVTILVILHKLKRRKMEKQSSRSLVG